MSQQIINIGTLPNDGTGDPLRTAYGKINDNFNELFTVMVNNTGVSFDIDFGTFISSAHTLNIDLGNIT